MGVGHTCALDQAAGIFQQCGRCLGSLAMHYGSDIVQVLDVNGCQGRAEPVGADYCLPWAWARSHTASKLSTSSFSVEHSVLHWRVSNLILLRPSSLWLPSYHQHCAWHHICWAVLGAMNV